MVENDGVLKETMKLADLVGNHGPSCFLVLDKGLEPSKKTHNFHCWRIKSLGVSHLSKTTGC